LHFVKSDLDKKLESYKAAYSGIFKEKLDVYKRLLFEMDELKDMLIRYANVGDEDDLFNRILISINNFSRQISNGSIFFNSSIANDFNNIKKEFQELFDLSRKRHLSIKYQVKTPD